MPQKTLHDTFCYPAFNPNPWDGKNNVVIATKIENP